MTRPLQLRVIGWNTLKKRLWYLLRVVAIDKVADPSAVHVELEFLDDKHAGRTHVALLPLPIRPAGPAAEFFRACGVEIVVGGTIAPKDALGAKVRVQFAKGDGDAWQAVRFAPMEDAAPAGGDGPRLAGSQGEQASRTNRPRASTGRRGRTLLGAPGETTLGEDSRHDSGASAARTEPEPGGGDKHAGRVP